MTAMMQALQSVTAGGPETLELRQVAVPDPGPGQVRLRVQAVGINYPDVLIIEDRYQFKPVRPFSPGAEVAGIVDAVGPGVSNLAPGARVIAMLGWGGLAEQVIAPAGACFILPDAIAMDQGAALLMTYGTSFHALRDRGQIRAGETLLVLGAGGGVGLAAVELGLALGARVIAAASSEAKLAPARDLGAIALVYPAEALDRAGQRAFSEAIKAANGGKGVDVILDPVGGSYAEPALRAIARGGRYLVVGFPAGIPALPFNLALLKECDIRGVFWGSHIDHEPAVHRAAITELLALCVKGVIQPRIHRHHPLADAPVAIQSLTTRGVTGKVIVTL